MFNIKSQVQRAVEDLLPAHIMSVAIDKLYESGFEIRLDTRGYLNNWLMAVLKRDPTIAAMVATQTDVTADDILRFVSFDDAQTVLLAASFLMLKLVEEKMYLDAGNQAVLSALMIVADAEHDENPEWAKLVPVAKEKAGKMFDECLRQGLYCHAVVN